MMAAGCAGTGGKGGFIAYYTGLQHVCKGGRTLPLAGHRLISSVPRACAAHGIGCTMGPGVSRDMVL